MAETNYTPILPFDITYGEKMSMYDNMTYVRDLALCTPDSIAMESGNVLKYFRCAGKEAVKIGGEENSAERMEEAIRKYKEYCKSKIKANQPDNEEVIEEQADNETEIDTEAAVSLLKDNSFSL